MRRLVWFGLGVAVTALVVARGRRWFVKVSPAGLVERVDQAGGAIMAKAKEAFGEFAEGRREAELELRRQAGLG
ncbi:MAG: hypothetical protein LBH76_06435 [Propionibacteriaceae bacterium]|jgi:hypothetical protein|nr:hypothetical protein [Propionibacteriaceae bacterium]